MLDKDGDSTRLEMAHVLFMDLVGYSRLSIEEQHSRIGALQELVRLRPAYKRAESEGALLAHPAGDGMALAFFGDPSSPAQCALEVAGAVAERSDLPLRMGIHTGTIHRAEDINRAANVRGPGINLAQRVMDCGDAGHILLSYTAADALTDSETWVPRLRDLLPHISRPGERRAACQVGCGALRWRAAWQPQSAFGAHEPYRPRG